MATYSDLTQYPQLYENTYWGNFKAGKGYPNSDIVNNRNEVAEQYSLLKNIMPRPAYLQYLLDDLRSCENKYLDHVETYEIPNKKVMIIVSPYRAPDVQLPPPRHWFTIPKIYSQSADSYAIIVPRGTANHQPARRYRW